MRQETFSQLLNRRPDGHKYDYGHVLVVGGSPGMVGAPLLVGKAALRTGAGLVTIAAPADVVDKLEKRVEEIMTLSLPDEAAFSILQFIKERKVSVIVIGPGLKVEARSAKLIKKLLAGTELPIVVDAGGLGALQNDAAQLDTAPGSLVLTPHVGEFQRLVDETLPEKRADLKPLARRFAKQHGVTLVLKGQPTYVARPEGSIYENKTGNPGLATAGTGDVLSGVIAGMISQGIAVSEAAEAAVYLHGLAGDIAAGDKTEPGMIASDVIEALPAALKRLTRPLGHGY